MLDLFTHTDFQEVSQLLHQTQSKCWLLLLLLLLGGSFASTP